MSNANLFVGKLNNFSNKVAPYLTKKGKEELIYDVSHIKAFATKPNTDLIEKKKTSYK